MEQMCSRILFLEEQSHDSHSAFARPENLRLKQQLRVCKLKCELADDVSVNDAVTMIAALGERVTA
eukprot:4844219-Pleurochrysis_carterae.AAC.1